MSWVIIRNTEGAAIKNTAWFCIRIYSIDLKTVNYFIEKRTRWTKAAAKIVHVLIVKEGPPWWAAVKTSGANAVGAGSIPGPGAKIPQASGPKTPKHKTEAVL